jgi:hypothetical protein
MERKEGDEKGLAPIRKRLNKDEELIRTAFKLHGMPKILLRNHVPVNKAKSYYDEYEITPEYSFKRKKDESIEVIEKSWTVKDDNGTACYSLLAPPVVATFIKQLVEVLDL